MLFPVTISPMSLEGTEIPGHGFQFPINPQCCCDVVMVTAFLLVTGPHSCIKHACLTAEGMKFLKVGHF